MFTITRRNISDYIGVARKTTETVSGVVRYVDEFSSGTHTTVIASVNGEELNNGEYTVYIKGANESDAKYERLSTVNAGEYLLKIVVSSEESYGEAVLAYCVYPQKITLQTRVATPYTVEYGSAEYDEFTSSTLGLTYRDANGYVFNFEDRGGVQIYYSSANYAKQTTRLCFLH